MKKLTALFPLNLAHLHMATWLAVILWADTAWLLGKGF